MQSNSGLITAFAVLTCFMLAACTESVEVTPAPAQSAPPAATSSSDLGDAILEGLMARSNNRVPDGASGPSFVVDPTWPKPLPNNWLIGQIGGLAVDSDDNIWVYHRPRSLDGSSVRALGPAGTGADGNPVDGLGNSRAMVDQIAGCCEVAPSVLKFDSEGNLLDAWGGPQDPGFLENNCREADGCFWPGREHGILVDDNGDVYISGNGTNFTGQFPWAATYGDDSHILKFTGDGEFIYQIGHAGMEGPDSDNIDGGPNGTPQPYLVADMSIDSDTNRMYVADGYGNRRILIVDADNGQYIGHFGAYGQNPVGDETDGFGDPYGSSEWVADYQSGNMKPSAFRSPLHCAVISEDGLLYACDRSNNRVQVFDVDASTGSECSNPNAEAGVCSFVREVHVAPYAASGTAVAAALSTDPGQTCLYVADLAHGVFYILDRESLTELDRIGRRGRQVGEFHWIHIIAVDSEGNVYTGEVDSGPRIQKFTRYGETSCSGTGYEDIGAYERNR
jgi:DNA-binding beta-propeller fold protein YncE